MRLQFISFLLGLLAALAAMAQTEDTVVLKTDKGEIEGTLVLSDAKGPMPVALIIAGSGPTDRNGNNPLMNNNSLKMLAEELAKNGIASLRYDKRGIGKSKAAGISEADLRFENYIQDAEGWVNYLNDTKKFSEVTIIGHSEGSLIGMIAAQNSGVAKFISFAGAGGRQDYKGTTKGSTVFCAGAVGANFGRTGKRENGRQCASDASLAFQAKCATLHDFVV